MHDRATPDARTNRRALLGGAGAMALGGLALGGPSRPALAQGG